MYSTSVAASGSGATHLATVSGREELRCRARRVSAAALGRGAAHAATAPGVEDGTVRAPIVKTRWREGTRQTSGVGAETMVEKGLPPEPQG